MPPKTGQSPDLGSSKMQSQFKKTLQSVREMLAALERDAVEDGISKIELEIVDSGPRELALRGALW